MYGNSPAGFGGAVVVIAGRGISLPVVISVAVVGAFVVGFMVAAFIKRGRR